MRFYLFKFNHDHSAGEGWWKFPPSKVVCPYPKENLPPEQRQKRIYFADLESRFAPSDISLLLRPLIQLSCNVLIDQQVITNKTFAKTFAGAMNRPALLPTLGIVCKLIFGKERAVMILEGQKVIPLKANEYKFPYLYPTIQKASAELAPFYYVSQPLNY